MSREALPRRLLNAALPGFCALFLLEYLYTSWTWLAFNRRPGLDQDVWLEAALAVREGRGLAMGNDHPLYTALLSLWAGRTPEVFTFSKLLSLAVLCATLGLAYRAGKSLFNRETGLLAAAFLSVNWIVFSLSFSLRAEVLLPPLFLCHWYCAWRGFRGDGRWWLGAGLFAGLAYLTKGTGTLLVLAWAAACLAVLLKDRSILRKVPWFLGGYLPLAAALWWGNRELFGDATYNFSVRHAVWLDSWDEVGRRGAQELTFAGYVARHGTGGVLRRLVSGAAAFLPVSLSCLSPAEAFPAAHALRWPLAAYLAAAVLNARERAAAAVRRMDGAVLYSLFLYAVFYLLFGWYQQVSSSERFIGPLNPILAVLLAAAGVSFWRARIAGFLRSRRARAYGASAAAGSALLCASALVMKASAWGFLNPFREDRPLPCYAEAYRLLDGGRRSTVFGPSGELTAWFLFSPPPRVMPPEEKPEDLAKWLEDNGAARLAVDWDMAEKPAWAGHFRREGEQGVRMTAPLPGWSVVYRDLHHAPPHLLVLDRR